MKKTTLPVRFIHSSDWQLGMTRWFLSTEAEPRFAQARIDAIAKLGKLAVEHQAQFIVVAGDVFESNQLSRQTVVRTMDALKALTVPVFLLPGNHDPLDGSSIFNTKEVMNAGDHVIVLRDSKPVRVPGLDNVEVLGAPWRTKHPSSDLCADLLANLEKDERKIRIVVAHGQVDSLSPDTARPEIIKLSTVEAAVNGGLVQYVALGDKHSLTNVGGSGRVWYSGAPLVTDFTEPEPNKAVLVGLGFNEEIETEALDVGDWKFIVEHFSINSLEDVQTFAAWLDGISDKERTVIKVSFEGSINLATGAELDGVMEGREDLFASLRRRERKMNLAIVPDELDKDSVSLTGYAKDAWDELVVKAEDDAVAQDALRLFYRLSGQVTS